MYQSAASNVKIDHQSVEVYVEPLLPPGKKRAQLKKVFEEEEKNKNKKKVGDTKYMKYLKARRKKEIDRFNWGVCLYKVFCCFRDKPPEGYFYYGPAKKLDPRTTREYRKPYKETREMKVQRKQEEEMARVRQRSVMQMEQEEMEAMTEGAVKRAQESGYGFGPGYGSDYGPGYGPGYGGAPPNDRPVQGRYLPFQTGPCECHENARKYRQSKGAPPDIPGRGQPGQPGGPAWLPTHQGGYPPPYGYPGQQGYPGQGAPGEEPGEGGLFDRTPCDASKCVCAKASKRLGWGADEGGEE
ncbi:hypothetical protein R5R35_009335 [Gryllus longicercus]|uniref:Uncharacterized protein n=1 Tax=Gryllus longicercus TaxID=2509291 RepID=A0AAN9VXX6_9ORTH